MFLFLFFFSFHLIIGGPISLDGIIPLFFSLDRPILDGIKPRSIFFSVDIFVVLDLLNFLVLYYCVAISCLLFACVLLPWIQ